MKRTICFLLLALALLSLPALAYTGGSFSIDIPDGYTANPAGGDYCWMKDDGSSVIVNVIEDAGLPNPYDWTQADAEAYGQELLSQMSEQLAASAADMGVSSEVRVVSASVGDMGAYRCVTVDFIAEYTGDFELVQYQRDILITTRERSYGLFYTAVGRDSLPDEAMEILGSFAATDELYTGKTGFFESLNDALSDLGLWGEVVKWAAIGGVCGLVWWYADRAVKRKKGAAAPSEDALNDFRDEK